MEQHQRYFKGVWIPKEIWLNKKLTITEKVFLAEIDSLDNGNRGCYASNQYFSDFFGLSKNRSSEIINTLKKKGYISVTYIREKGSKSIKERKIKVFDKPSRPVRDSDTPIRDSEKVYSENGEENSISFNNQLSNKDNVGQPPSVSKTDSIPYKDILDYLNGQADRNYSHTTQAHRRLIKARYNERIKAGKTHDQVLQDFKYVIDVKVREWKNDKKMNVYLRPKTLFNASNFEGYLNQPMKEITTKDLDVELDDEFLNF